MAGDNEEIIIRAVLEDLVSGAMEKIGEVAQSVSDAVSSALEALANGFSAVDASVANTEDQFNSLNEITSASDEALKSISDSLAGTSEAFVGLDETASTANESLDAISASISGGAMPAFEELDRQVTITDESLVGIANVITGQFGPAMDSFNGDAVAAQEALNGISASLNGSSAAFDGFAGSINSVDAFFAALEENITGGVIPSVDALTFTSENADAVLSGISDVITELNATTVAATVATTDFSVAQDVATTSTTAYAAAATAATAATTGYAAAATATGTAMNAANQGTITLTASAQQLAAAQGLGTQAAQDSANAIDGAGYGAILGATSMLVMAGAAAKLGIDMVKSGADSEAALTRVASLTGASADQMTYYKGQIEQMAETMGATIPDLSAGLYDILSVGYQGADAMNVLKESTKAAVAGGTDLHTVTNGLTSIMKAFAFSGSDAANAVDILMTGVREGKAPFADFSRAIGLVANISHEAGFKIDEVTAALSTMTVVYPTVRQAGQNLQALITNIGIQTDKLAERAKKLKVPFDEAAFSGMSLAQRLGYLWTISGQNVQVFEKLMGNITSTKAAFTLLNSSNVTQVFDQLYSAVGVNDAQFKQMADHMGKAFDAVKFGAMNSVDKVKYLNSVFGDSIDKMGLTHDQSIALATAFDYASGIGADFARNLGQMANASGATESAFQAHSLTIVGAMQRIQGAISVLDMNFSQVLEPVILEVMNVVGDVVDKVAALFESHADVMTGVVIVLAVAIGGALVGALYALAAIMGGIMATALTVSMTFSGLAVAMLGVGFAIKHAYDNSLPFRDALNQVWDASKKLFESFQTALIPIFLTVVGSLQNVTQWFGNLFFSVKEVKETAQGATDKLSGMAANLDSTGTKLDGVVTKIVTVSGPLAGVIDYIKGFAGIVDDIANKIDYLGAMFGGFSDNQKRLAEQSQETGKHMHGLARPFSIMVDKTGSLLNPMDVFNSLLNTVSTTVLVAAGALASLGGGLLAMWLIMSGPLPAVFTPLMENFLVPIGSLIYSMGAGIITTAGSIYGFIESIVVLISNGTLGSTLLFMLDSAFTSMSAAITGAVAAAAPFVAMFVGVAAIIAIIIASVVLAWQKFDILHAMFAAIALTVMDFGKTLMGSLGPALKEIQTTVQSTLLPVWNQLVKSFNEAKPLLQVLGGIILGAIVVALVILTSLINGALKAIGPLLVMVVDIVGGLIGAIAAGIGFIIDFALGMKKIGDAIIDFLIGKISGDQLKSIISGVFKTLLTDIINFARSMGMALYGAFVQPFVAIGAFVQGFCDAVAGWFKHLSDILVGHSIVPDMMKLIHEAFTLLALPLQVVIWFVKLIISLFESLRTGSLAPLKAFTGQVTAAFTAFIGGPLGLIKNFTGKAVAEFHDLSHKGIAAVGNLVDGAANGARAILAHAPPLIKQAGTAIVDHLQSTAKLGLNTIDQLLNGTANKSREMKDITAAHANMMQAGVLTNIIRMKTGAIQHFELMKASLVRQIAQTSDPVKKAALEMQLAQVNNAEIAEKASIASAERKRAEVVKKAQQEMHDASEQARLAKENVVQRFMEMASQGLDKVKTMASNVLSSMENFVGSLVNRAMFMKQQVMDHFNQLGSQIKGFFDNLINQAPGFMGGFIDSLTGGLLSKAPKFIGSVMDMAKKAFKPVIFNSPAEVGPGRDADKWMPNLITMMAQGLANGSGTMGGAATGMMQSVKQAILTGANGAAAAGVTSAAPSLLGGSGGALAIRGGSGSQNVTVTINMTGGLGAGLQLLNPNDRATFVKQIADEMGRETRLQGNFTNGYGNQ